MLCIAVYGSMNFFFYWLCIHKVCMIPLSKRNVRLIKKYNFLLFFGKQNNARAFQFIFSELFFSRDSGKVRRGKV